MKPCHALWLLSFFGGSITSGLAQTPAPATGETVAVLPASVLKAFDLDQSGDLSAEELARWEAAKAARREKYAAQRAEMLTRYDADGDGRISEVEKAAAKLAMQSERTAAEAERIKRIAEKQTQAKATAKAEAGAEFVMDGEAPTAPVEPSMGETAAAATMQ